MPTINSVSKYVFKVVDFLTAKQGLLLKLALINDSASEDYCFAFIPYDRVPSILMLEYLIGRKTCTAELLEIVASALKAEFGGEKIVVIQSGKVAASTDVASNQLAEATTTEAVTISQDYTAYKGIAEGETIQSDPVGVGNSHSASQHELSGGSQINGRSSINADGSIFTDRVASEHGMVGGAEVAEMILDNNYLKIIRDIHISKRVLDKITTIGKHELSIRVIDNELVVSRLEEADRPNSSGASIEKYAAAERVKSFSTLLDDEATLSIRDSVKALSLMDDLGNAERVRQFATNTIFNQLLATRDDVKFTTVDGKSVSALRELVSSAVISHVEQAERSYLKSSVLAKADAGMRIVRIVPTRVEKIIEGVRSIEHATTKLESYQAKRDHINSVTLTEVIFRGRLKFRQFPTLLDKSLIRAVRNVATPTHLQTVLGFERLNSSDLTLHRIDGYERLRVSQANKLQLVDAVRNLTGEALIERNIVGSNRYSTRDLSLANILQSQRVSTRGIELSDSLIAAAREVESQLYVPPSITGFRVYEFETHVGSGSQGDRKARHSIFLPDKNQVAERDAVKDLLLGRASEASRDRIKDLTLADLLEGKRDQSNEVSLLQMLLADKTVERTTQLVSSILSQRSNQKSTVLGEEVVASVQRVKELLLHRGFDASRTNKQVHISRLLDAMRETRHNAFVRDHMRAGKWFGRIWEAIMMDDEMMFGEVEVTLAVLFDLLAASDRHHDDYSYVMEPQFMAGVYDRIGVLVDSGIMAVVPGSKGGLLFFDQQEASRATGEAEVAEIADGENVFRPAEITVENPLGWLQMSEAQLTGKVQMAQPARNLRGDFFFSFMGGMETDRLGNHLAAGMEGYVPSRQGQQGLESQLATVSIRGGITSDLYSMAHRQESGGGELSEEYSMGFVDQRGGTHLGGLSMGGRGMSEGISVSVMSGGARDTQGTALTDEPMVLSSVDDRRGQTVEEVTFGNLNNDRAFIEELYSWADKESREAVVETTDYTATDYHDKIALLSTGFVFGKTMEERAECLSDLVAIAPSLAAGYLETYIDSIKQVGKDAFAVDDTLHYVQLVQETILEEDLLARGLIYNYEDDMVYGDGNPSVRTGGFGVPVKYDPTDPLNPYYPWSRELDATALSQDEWVPFGEGQWNIQASTREFVSEASGVKTNGVFRNDFSHTDYVFWTSFQVTGDGDNGVGIVFGYVDSQNYYKFVMSGGDSDNSLMMPKPMQLFKVVNGVSRQVGSPIQPYAWVKNRWHTVKVSLVGGRIKLYVDSLLEYDLTEYAI